MDFLENFNVSVQQARYVTDAVVVQEKVFVTHLKIVRHLKCSRSAESMYVVKVRNVHRNHFLCHYTEGDNLGSLSFPPSVYHIFGMKLHVD